MSKILIVEDDTSFGLMIAKFLEKNGYQPAYTKSSEEALVKYVDGKYSIVLTDLKLPGSDGIDLLKKIKEINPEQTVVLMTSHGHVRTAVRAIKQGAFEYITKPINHEELLEILKEASKTRSPELATKKKDSEFDFIKAKSEVYNQVLEQADLVAGTNLSVLIQGESGTGKEYLSRYIHQMSSRSHLPFVAVDCGALSNELAASELFGHVKGSFTGATHDKNGQFTVADGGTIFLDEIGNLSYEVQVQLLRALQEKTIRRVGDEKSHTVDVRVIAATNESLTNKVAKGTFREDLYHRINEFQLEIPPLRERKEDLDTFLTSFITQSNKEFNKSVAGVSEQARNLIFDHHWSGNIRELKNVIRRAVLIEKSSQLQASSLPFFLKEQPREVNATSDLKKINRNTEIETIKSALESTRYNKSRAAKMLNIDRTTLYEKIRKYDL